MYVNEVRLPWQTEELEETIPPPESQELQQLLHSLKNGITLHMVPASRYLKKGFEIQSYQLPGEREIQIATLQGLVRIWVWRAFEFWSQGEQLGPDLYEISQLRSERLQVILKTKVSSELRHVMGWLQRGYDALAQQDKKFAMTSFENANGALDQISR